MKFRLLYGLHAEPHPTLKLNPGMDNEIPATVLYGAKPVGHPDGVPPPGWPENMGYPGDIVESNQDLCLLHNPRDPHLTKKFVRVDDSGFEYGSLPASCNMWDSSKESLEQFNARMTGKMHVQGGHLPKSDTAQVHTAAQQGHGTGLAQLSEKELRKMCDEEGRDHRKAKSKEDLIRLLNSVEAMV